MIRKLGIAVGVFVFSFSLVALPRQIPSSAEPQRAPGSFNEPFAIGTATQNAVLRAVDANSVHAVRGRSGMTYAGAFRGVDVSRSTSGGIGEERMFVSDPSASRTFEYEVVSLNGIVGASADGRAIRFFGRNPEEPVVTLSAPEVRDRDGKSSHRVWWEISADRSGAPTKLRLRMDDPLLAYPLSIRYSIESLARSELIERGPRPSRVQTLQTTGAISGTLTDAVNGDPIPFELVHAYDGASQWVASGVSNAGGVYTISGLPAGTYYVLAVPYEWDSELYDEKPCPGRVCTITSGDPVTVTVGNTTTGINFTLNSLNARIAGTVSDADTNVGLGGVNVIAYDSSGNWAGSGFSQSNGSYVISLPSAGTYYAKTTNFTHAGYVDQVYNAINCTGCAATTGTPITANIASVTENIDFPLDPNGGSISGQLTDAQTGAPIPFEFVFVHDAAGAGVTYGFTDGSGNYTTFNGLATGNYYLYSTPPGYAGEVYDDIACGVACDPSTGTAIPVTVGVATTGIDLALSSTATRVTGTVTDATTTQGLESVLVGIYDGSGELVDYGVTNINGDYSVSLPGSGTYFARTFASQTYPTYVDELYNDIPCLACSVTTGTQISVVSGQTATGIDFALSSNGGSISGRVTDTNSVPIESTIVYFYDSLGNNVTYAFTDANGDYTSFHALAAGTYYVTTSPFGYAGELYDNLPCPDGACNPTTGTGVIVTAGQNTANIDFALASNIARIRGTVVDESNNSPAVNVDVVLYDASGNFVTAVPVNGAGTYELNTSVGGTYYVATFSYGDLYANELYDNIPCSGCDPTTGTPVTATVGTVTDNIDFALTSISCPTIEVTPFTLPGGTLGDSYSQTVEASGGNAPYTFELFESSLPTGLTLNATTGDITGTLSAPGEFTFTILATDDNGCVGGRTYIVYVTDGPPSITNISPSSGPTTGGTSVTITGTNLSTVSSVAFAASNAAITSVTATAITVDSPPHSVGPVDVIVTTSGGTATAINGFTYVQPTTQVTLVSSLNPSMYGDSVTFTATLEDDSATGTVTFYDDATALATVAVSAGVAQYTTSSLSAGSHPITAQYSGDANYGPSTSNVVNQQVNKLTRTISLDVTPAGSSTYGDTVTLTATLNPADEATSVTFYDGTTVLGTAPVSGNTATFATSSLQAGSYVLTAETAETANYFAAMSAPVAHTVNKAPRSISLVVAPSPSTYGDTVTLTATVSPSAEAATVEFYDGATLLGSSPVVSGSAVFTTSAFNAGTHILTASTAETTNYLGATSAPISHLVNKASPVFSNLTSPTIIVGTVATTISGTISAGSLIPPGNVTITVAATSYTAAIDGSGNFSVSVATGSLAVGAYPIAFSYAGDSNFNSASGSSTLTVTFGILVTKDPSPKNSPATMPIRIKIVDVDGNNYSSSSITLTAYGFRLTSSVTWLPPNPTGNLQFQSAQGGQYRYNLRTEGLAAGTYVFGFTVEGDPVIHEIPFTVD